MALNRHAKALVSAALGGVGLLFWSLATPLECERIEDSRRSGSPIAKAAAATFDEACPTRLVACGHALVRCRVELSSCDADLLALQPPSARFDLAERDEAAEAMARPLVQRALGELPGLHHELICRGDICKVEAYAESDEASDAFSERMQRDASVRRSFLALEFRGGFAPTYDLSTGTPLDRIDVFFETGEAPPGGTGS